MTGLRSVVGGVRREARAAAARGLRTLRLGARAADLPAIFGNSMAKAGSHLLAQYLEGLAMMTPLLFLDRNPLRTISAQGMRATTAEVEGQLRHLHPGEIRWGYLPARPELVASLLQGNRIVYFLYRDPRDKVVSRVLYALDLHKGHAMHGHYASLPGMEARIEASIRGVPGLAPDIRSSYESYLAWLDQPAVMAVSYEQLVRDQRSTAARMLSRVQAGGVELRSDLEAALDLLQRVMAPARSPTFRAGKPGNWQEHFTEANKRSFKEVAGDLLLRLGYERGNDW